MTAANCPADVRNRFSRLLCSLGVIFLLLPGTAAAQDDQPHSQMIARGQYHYQRYCEVCHGETGKGNGPMRAYLTVTPADLTQLRYKNKDTFPFWQVYRTVDGREMVRGHGSREMPIWGDEIRIAEPGLPTAFQEDVVAGRIWQLILYVESLQEK